MTLRERFGLAGLAAIAAGAIAVTMLSRPFTTPAFATDTDNDGLSNAFETAYGTNLHYCSRSADKDVCRSG